MKEENNPVPSVKTPKMTRNRSARCISEIYALTDSAINAKILVKLNHP